MKPDRFGSYSKRSTTAGSLRWRLKSTSRYSRRWCGACRPRTVICPVLLRPACDLIRIVSFWSGRPFQRPFLLTIRRWRRPGEVGLYLNIGASVDVFCNGLIEAIASLNKLLPLSDRGCRALRGAIGGPRTPPVTADGMVDSGGRRRPSAPRRATAPRRAPSLNM